MPNQTKNNNLSCLFNPTFTEVNRLFVLSFENEDDRTSFSTYYVPSVEIKDFNVLIDETSFLDNPIKSKKKHMNKLLKWEEIMITQLVIYWIMNISQSTIS